MQNKDSNFYKEGYFPWEREEGKTIWWTSPVDVIGEIIFSFDKKKVFNFWQDYPEKLTKEQIEIFKKENPDLAELKPAALKPAAE